MIDNENQILMLLLSLLKACENLLQALMLVGENVTMDETRRSLLTDYLRMVVTSGMTTSGRETKSMHMDSLQEVEARKEEMVRAKSLDLF